MPAPKSALRTPKMACEDAGAEGSCAMTTVAEKKRTAVAAKQWAEKASRLGTLQNFHIAGVVVLGLVNLYLLAHMAFAWRAANSQNAAALADQTVR